ncbi:MAG: tetratricopeptide repeat protein [Myxococcota bacterium]
MWWFAPAAAQSADPDELLHLARERMRHGDFAGVRLVADEALAVPGDHQRTAQYLIAMSWELGGDPTQALALYDALEQAAGADVPDDLRFRRAECLGRLARYDEARDELRQLPNVDRPALDQLKIDVLEGIWDLELGRERRGYRGLGDALDRAEPGVGTYYQAAARHAILARATDAAALLVFDGSDRAKGKALEQRAALIEVGNEQLAEIVRTEETGFALDGFVRLARAHRDLGQDLLDESPLVKLTEAQRAINRDLLEDKVEAIWTKATLYYDRGLGLAARMDWTSEPVGTMHAEYDAVVAMVDRLTARP